MMPMLTHRFALVVVGALAVPACGRTALTGIAAEDSGTFPPSGCGDGRTCGDGTANCSDLGVVAYWSFAEGQGQIVQDVVGAHDGVVRNATPLAAWVPGRVDFAYQFGGWAGAYAPFDSGDERGDFIEIPDANSLDLAGDQISISAWVKPDPNHEQDRQVVVAKSSCGNSTWIVEFNPQDCTGPKLNFFLDVGAAPHGDTCSQATVSPGTWGHVVMVYDGASKYIYLDGQLDTVAAAHGKLPVVTDPVRIGTWGTSLDCGGTPTRYFYGAIDEVAIFARALSPDEVRRLHQAGLDGSPACKASGRR